MSIFADNVSDILDVLEHNDELRHRLLHVLRELNVLRDA
jgi:hypothetical protein